MWSHEIACESWFAFAECYLEWCLGKGMRRSRNQWRKAPFHWMKAMHSVNEGFGKEFYRKGNSVKRSAPFSEPPDSENWILLRSSREEKTHKHKQIWGIVPVDWVGSKILFTCFFGAIPDGGKKTHINKIPPPPKKKSQDNPLCQTSFEGHTPSELRGWQIRPLNSGAECPKPLVTLQCGFLRATSKLGARSPPKFTISLGLQGSLYLVFIFLSLFFLFFFALNLRSSPSQISAPSYTGRPNGITLLQTERNYFFRINYMHFTADTERQTKSVLEF